MKDKIGKLNKNLVWAFALGAIVLGIAAAWITSGMDPFAMDGGAAFFLFDTREAPASGEYPIVFCHSSELGGGWDGVTRLEGSFLECCQSTIDPNDAD